MAIKAIIFDCFGVLVEDSMNLFLETYLADKQEVAEEIKALDHESVEGKITWSELLSHIERLTAIDRKEIETFLDQNPQNLPLFEYIATELRPHYKLSFLSNAADDWLQQLFADEQLELFDDFVLSYQHGMRKPESAIFELAAKRLGVQPSECVVVDDNIEYCEGAETAGMQAVRYMTFEQVKNDMDLLISRST